MQTSELDQLVEEMFKARREYQDADKVKKALGEKMDELEGKVVDALTSLEKDNWDSSSCKVSISHRTSVRVPKEREEKLAFFSYLQEKGVFEDMVSVNSNTLNAYYKEQLEQALEQGDVDFRIPGIGEASIKKTLQVRAK